MNSMTMKFKFALVASLLLMGGVAQAAQGQRRASQFDALVPPVDRSCSISIGGGDVDYGSVTRHQLQEQPGNQLSFGKRTVPVSVACPYPRVMKVGIQGERSADGQFRYGAQGSLQVRLSDASLDGKSVLLTRISASGVPMGPAADSVTVLVGERVVAGDASAPAKGRNLSLKMEVEPVLSDSAARVNSREHSDARVTLQLER